MARTITYAAKRPAEAIWELVTNRHRVANLLGKIFLYAILIFGAVLVTIPFIWMISSSLKPQAQLVAFPPIWIPDPILWENYPKALTALPFDRFIANTLIIAVGATLGTLVSSSLGAYAFSRLRWRFRDTVFFLLLLTMMLPGQITMIPRFVLFARLGWVNTYLPLIVPAWFANPFFVFLIRQFFMGLPSELDDAARIDGASIFGHLLAHHAAAEQASAGHRGAVCSPASLECLHRPAYLSARSEQVYGGDRPTILCHRYSGQL